MADSFVEANPGSLGAKFGTDEVATEHFPVGKIAHGAYGSVTLVSTSSGLPIQNDSSAITVDNGGTFVVQEDGAALTALQKIDDVVHVDDAGFTLGTSSGVMMMGFAGTQSVNANDAGAIAMETDGAIHIHDGGNTITVDGTVTANPASGTIDTVTTVTAVTDITNTIDSTISGDALTALNLLDDIVHIDDTATHTTGVTKGALFMGVAVPDDAAISANDIGAVGMSLDRRLHVDAQIVDQDVNLTVDLGTTDNAVLDSIVTNTSDVATATNQTTISSTLTDIETNTDFGAVTGGGVELGALRVTLANDSTGVLTVDGTVTANPASGTIDTVTTVAAVTDITNTIDTTISGNAATSLSLLDDVVVAQAVSASSAKVSMAGAVRDDSLSALTPIEGDAVPLRVNSTGALHVTGGGGGTEYNVDDAGPTVVTMAGAVRDDSLTTLTEDDGDATLLRVSSTGALHVTGGGGGTEYTEDIATPATIVGTATMMERVDAPGSVTPIEGDWIALRGSVEGALWTQDFNSDAVKTAVETVAAAVSTEMQVDIVGALPAGTAAIGKLAANSGVDIGDVDVTSITGVTMSNAGMQITGDEAHDAVDAGNPLKIGAYATSSVEGITEVANADRTNLVADLNGVLITRQDVAPQELISTSQSVTATTSTAATNFDAPGAGKHNYITSVTIFNSHAATNTHVLLQDGSGGTTRWVLPAPATGGVTHNFSPPLKQTTANTALYFAAGAAVTTIYVSIAGYQGDG